MGKSVSMCKYKVARTLRDVNMGGGTKFMSGKKATDLASSRNLKVYKLNEATKEWYLWWKKVK